jgi:hypothetical protein
MQPLLLHWYCSIKRSRWKALTPIALAILDNCSSKYVLKNKVTLTPSNGNQELPERPREPLMGTHQLQRRAVRIPIELLVGAHLHRLELARTGNSPFTTHLQIVEQRLLAHEQHVLDVLLIDALEQSQGGCEGLHSIVHNAILFRYC